MAARLQTNAAPTWPLAALALLLGLIAAADAQRARMCSVCTDCTFTTRCSLLDVVSHLHVRPCLLRPSD